MVRGIENEKKKKNVLMEDKDYLSEAWVQGGKAIGDMVSKSKNKK